MDRCSHITILLILVSTAGFAAKAEAGVYNLHLTTDNTPDYTNLDSFVRSATAHLETPQEKCIAVWRWGRRSRRQTSNSTEDGRLVWDPILHYNSYGTMNCGVISGLNMASWLKLGYYYYYHGAPQCISHRGKDGWRYCSDDPVNYRRTLINGASSYMSGFSVILNVALRSEGSGLDS